MDFLRSPTPPPGGGGWTLDFLGCPRDPLHRPQPTSKSLRIMAKTQNFARSLRSRGSPWVQEGGVGPWTFWEVQGTLQEGGVGPWTFWEVQGTLHEGVVGPWSLDSSFTTGDLRSVPEDIVAITRFERSLKGKTLHPLNLVVATYRSQQLQHTHSTSCN